ncbi:hypothetical protein Tsubulata_011086 [Turnera subulata]|uniref:DUF4283 domain-containing protein n=1 Tax=Turnera subulata TaxID=218843 RepID=A0A9Q0F9L6_9ROSI|nr:hypothetical protein Tsubulata_011086 [Turnera subulata]
MASVRCIQRDGRNQAQKHHRVFRDYRKAREGISYSQVVGTASSSSSKPEIKEIMLELKVDVKTLGGEYVLISFDTRESMLVCIQDGESWISEVFLLVKEWEEDDFALNRVCWLNIYGTPPQAWCQEFFMNISVQFGKFIRLFNDFEGSSNLDVAQVQIMTTHKEPISRSFKALIGDRFLNSPALRHFNLNTIRSLTMQGVTATFASL